MTLLLALLAPVLAAKPAANAEVQRQLAAFMEANSEGITLSPKAGEIRAEGKGLSFEAEGIRIKVGLTRSIDTASTGASMVETLSWLTLDELPTGLDLPGWSVDTHTPVSSKRTGIRLESQPDGGLRVAFDWEIFLVSAYKQTEPCLAELRIMDKEEGLPGCSESVRKRVPVHVDFTAPLVFAPDTPAPDTRTYSTWLEVAATTPVPCAGSCWRTRLATGPDATWAAGGMNTGATAIAALTSIPAQGSPSQRTYTEWKPIEALAALPDGAAVGGPGFFARLDATGEPRWSHALAPIPKEALSSTRVPRSSDPPSITDEVHELLVLPDGDLLAVGTRVRRLDAASGAVRWEGGFDSRGDLGRRADLLPGGDLVVVGDCKGLQERGFHGNVDFLVTRWSPEGKLQWSRCLGGKSIDRAQAVVALSSGDIVVAGPTYSKDGDVSCMDGQNMIWAVGLDGAGRMGWQRCLGSTRVADHSPMTVVAGLFENPEGVLLVGSNNGEDIEVERHGGTDALLVQLGPAGEPLWQQSLGGPKADLVRDAAQVDGHTALMVWDSTATRLLRLAAPAPK